jgi:hypothetical protein
LPYSAVLKMITSTHPMAKSRYFAVAIDSRPALRYVVSR